MDGQTLTQHLKLDGSLAISRAPALQSLVMEALDGSSSVCLDVSEATDIDVSFLQIMVAAQKTAKDEGKRLTISDRGSAHLREQIRRCGLPEAALPTFS